MDIARTRVVLRRRSGWEGVDLGFALARRFYWRLWLLWWITALPIALLSAVAWRGSPGWILLTVWWFKPLYEVMLVQFLGAVVFGDQPTWGELRSTARGMLKREALARILPLLLWRRVGFSRSFIMPVTLLERLRGRAWRQRCGVLGRGQGEPFWLTIAGLHLETVLQLSLLTAIFLFVPEEWLLQWWGGSDWLELLGEQSAFSWVFGGAGRVAMSIFAPFYVGGGLGVYIARRTRLEGWDIELGFRRIAARLAPGSSGPRGNRTLAGLAACALVACLWYPAPGLATAGAAPAESRPAPVALEGPDHAQELIAEVTSDEVFGKRVQRERWVFVGEEDDQTESFSVSLQGLAQFLEFLMWVIVAVAVGWLLSVLLGWRAKLPARDRVGDQVEATPSVVFGLPVTAESLPGDIVGEARGLLAAGRLREALGLLYRATLACLIQTGGVHIRSSTTERECLRMVHERRPVAEAGYFARLTRLWVRMAYAHREPAAAELDGLLRDWPALFAPGVGEAATGGGADVA